MRNLEKGQHIFIAFRDGKAVLDSQLRPRIYTSLENADKWTPTVDKGKIEYVEYVPTLTPPNEWVSVYDRLPEPGERVLATDCGFVGEFYINKRGKWQRYNVNCSELLMALDILYWMPLPAPPDKDNHVPAKAPNEPLTCKGDENGEQ